jgi:hypothetical protein
MPQFGECGLQINRDYKDGEDIRPLKPTGEQNLRFAQLKFQEEEAKKKQLPIPFIKEVFRILPIGLPLLLMPIRFGFCITNEC